MVKFQGVNRIRLCKDYKCAYVYADMLKQTSVESAVQYLARCGYSKQKIKSYIFGYLNLMLDRMIVEI